MFQWFKNWKQTRFNPSYQFDENHENVVRKLIEHRYQKGEWWKCIDDLVCLDGGMPSNQTIVDFYNSFHVVCKDAQKAAQHFKQTKIVNDVLMSLH